MLETEEKLYRVRKNAKKIHLKWIPWSWVDNGGSSRDYPTLCGKTAKWATDRFSVETDSWGQRECPECLRVSYLYQLGE